MNEYKFCRANNDTNIIWIDVAEECQGFDDVLIILMIALKAQIRYVILFANIV